MILSFVFWAAFALLLHTYFGYPLWLWALARMRPRPVQRGDALPRVAIVVVGFNESARIDAKVATCLAQDYPADRLELVIVSDGSTDDMAARVRACADPRVKLVAMPQRRGKAACLADGVAATDAEVVVFTDARQPLHGQAVRKLVANLADPSVGVVSGELVLRTEDSTGFGAGVDAYWRYEKFIRRHEAATGSVVGVTGALYAMRRELFGAIPPQTILDDVLIPMRAACAGARVVFESEAVAYDKPSVDARQEGLRKVRTLAGNFQLLALMPSLLNPARNPLFLRFVAHKLLRLLAPLAMLAMLLANLALAAQGVFWPLLLAGQVLFYAAALAGAAFEPLRRFLPLRLASTFVTMNWFVLRGFAEFVSNRQAHLWSAAPAASRGPAQ